MRSKRCTYHFLQLNKVSIVALNYNKDYHEAKNRTLVISFLFFPFTFQPSIKHAPQRWRDQGMEEAAFRLKFERDTSGLHLWCSCYLLYEICSEKYSHCWPQKLMLSCQWGSVPIPIWNKFQVWRSLRTSFIMSERTKLEFWLSPVFGLCFLFSDTKCPTFFFNDLVPHSWNLFLL